MTLEAPAPAPIPPRRPLAVLRVVGPPGAGKTLLITVLTQALRSRAHRVGRVEVTRLTDATVITLSNESRVTVAGDIGLDQARDIARTADPSLDLLLAEGYDAPGVPAVAVVRRGMPYPESGPPSFDIIATVESEALAASFARSGPGAHDRLITALVQRIERDLLGVAVPFEGWRTRLGRWFWRTP